MSDIIISSLSIPSNLFKTVVKLAKKEGRTKSGLIQEAIRYYIEVKKWRELQRDIKARAANMGINSENDVEKLIDSVRK
jgi:metal-responsive CopG/Arc/MetJ family transcriptional regulator